jgi:hypothetical protein
LLEDPYSTVRYIAHRSLTQLTGFQDFAYDFIGPLAERTQARERVVAKWELLKAPYARPEIRVDDATWARLLRERNNKSMYLQE